MARFYKTPYVQNIPDYGYELPFNEILAGLDQKQKKFDEAAEIPDLIDDKLLKVETLFPEDKEYLQNYRTSLYDEIDNLSTSVNGDYSKIQPQLKNIARKVNRDMTQGPLANIMNWTEQGKKYLEAKNKLGAEGKYHERFTEELAGGKEFNAKMNKQYDPNAELSPYSFTFAHAKAPEEEITHNLFSDIEADAIATNSFNKKTGWTTDESKKGIYMEKIYKTAVLNLGALPPDFQRELNFRVSNASEEELIANAGQFFGKYYGNTEEGKKLAQQTLNESIEAAKAGDFTSLEQAYKAEYVGRQGERFGYKDISSKEGPDTAYIKYLDDKKQSLPTVIQTYGTADEGGSIIPNPIDNLAGGVSFDSKGNATAKTTTKHDTANDSYIINIGGTSLTVPFSEIIAYAKNNPDLKNIALYDTEVSGSGVTTIDKNINSKILNAYIETIDVNKIVNTTANTIKETYGASSTLGNDGTMTSNPQYDFDGLTDKETIELFNNATKDRASSSMFNINSRPTDETLINSLNNEFVKDFNVVGRNMKVLDKGAKKDGSIEGTATDLGYTVLEFTDNFKTKASVVAIRPNSIIYNMQDKKGNTKQISLEMSPQEKGYFKVSSAITNAAKARTPFTFTDQLQDGTKIVYNYRPLINKDKVSTTTNKKGVFEDKISYQVIYPNGKTSTTSQTSLEELLMKDLQYFLINKQQNK